MQSAFSVIHMEETFLALDGQRAPRLWRPTKFLLSLYPHRPNVQRPPQRPEHLGYTLLTDKETFWAMRYWSLPQVHCQSKP